MKFTKKNCFLKKQAFYLALSSLALVASFEGSAQAQRKNILANSVSKYYHLSFSGPKGERLLRALRCPSTTSSSTMSTASEAPAATTTAPAAAVAEKSSKPEIVINETSSAGGSVSVSGSAKSEKPLLAVIAIDVKSKSFDFKRTASTSTDFNLKVKSPTASSTTIVSLAVDNTKAIGVAQRAGVACNKDK